MQNQNKRWTLDVLSHSEALSHQAMAQVRDTNEARLLVHGVIADALEGMSAAVSNADLEGAMGAALGLHRGGRCA